MEFEDIPRSNYDLVINCGALSEAILSQHFQNLLQILSYKV